MTHEILVGVDVAAEAELLAFAKERDDVIQVGLVVLAPATAQAGQLEWLDDRTERIRTVRRARWPPRW